MPTTGLPAKYFRQRTHYRNLSGVRTDDLIGCGFMLKPGVTFDQRNYYALHYSLVYVLRGKGVLIDDRGREYPLAAGDAFQRVPARQHTLKLAPDSNWAECFLAIGTTLQESLVPYGLILPDVPVLHPGLSQTIAGDFDRLLRRLAGALERELPRVLIEAQLLISDVYARHHRAASPDPYRDLIAEACMRLAAEPAARTPLPEVCGGLGISYERFRKVFQQQMKMTPGQYRIRSRIDAACAMLTEGHLSLQQIAAALGYPSVYAFSAQFKSAMGIPPGSFRR